MDRTATRRALIVLLAAIPVALVVTYSIPVCPTASLFGIPCPGCGLTRATLAALRGDFHAALHFHPLVFVLTPVYAGLLGLAVVQYVRGPEKQSRKERSLWTRRSTTVVGGALVTLVIGVWVARFAGHFGGPAPVNHVLPKLVEHAR